MDCTHHRSSSHACFGTATRDAASKVFLSEEHAVAAMGANGNRRNSPGPGHYSQRSCIGKHPVYKSLPAWGAGTEQRFKAGVRSIINETPAPWHYNTSGSVGRQSGRGGKGAGFGTSTRDGRYAALLQPQEQQNLAIQNLNDSFRVVFVAHALFFHTTRNKLLKYMYLYCILSIN